jgi:protein-tyrosine phosphatase
MATRERRFRLSWVLIDELAVGPAPLADHHQQRLADEGVAAVLSLCRDDEAPRPSGLEQRFVCDRWVLPDHRAGRLPAVDELRTALLRLEALRAHGPVFVHCVAAMERSPLVCLAWLVSRHGQTPQRALDYLMQVHPGTNPLPGQLALLRQLGPCPGSATDRTPPG